LGNPNRRVRVGRQGGPWRFGRRHQLTKGNGTMRTIIFATLMFAATFILGGVMATEVLTDVQMRGVMDGEA
jgi:hypothetical protein